MYSIVRFNVRLDREGLHVDDFGDDTLESYS